MRRGLRLGGWALLAVACMAIAALVAIAWLHGADAALGRLASLASLASAALTLVALVVAVTSAYLAWRAISPQASVENAGDELAKKIATEWRTEAMARGLAKPQPIPVRWSATRLPVSATAGEILNVPAEPGAVFELQGDVTTVAERFLKLPARQLAIIGPPGSGKTSLAVVLVRDLLARRRSGEPVPVLLSAADWSPREGFDSWMVRRLREQYPQVMAGHKFGANIAELLVKGGHILPVLDGLDEIRMERGPQESSPEDRLPAIIDLLNSAVGDDRPIVATCRTAEFQLLIAQTGRPLLRAAVVEIQPVTIDQAAQYLPAGQTDGANRWAAVIRHITTHPGGALAQALSLPLNVFLARAAYAKRDPGHLTTFTEPKALGEHLLAEYLPAVYAPPGIREGRARRWLGFIAIYTQQDDGGCFDDFANALRFDLRFAFGTPELMFGLFTTILFGRMHGMWLSLLAGLAYLVLAEFCTRRAPVLGILGRIGFTVVLVFGTGVWVGEAFPAAERDQIAIAVGAAYLLLATLFSLPVLRKRLVYWLSYRRMWKARAHWPEGYLHATSMGFAEIAAEALHIHSRFAGRTIVAVAGVLTGVWSGHLFNARELLVAGFAYLLLTELIYLIVAEILFRSTKNILFGVEASWLRSGQSRRWRIAITTLTTWFAGFGVGFGLIDGAAAGTAIGIAGWLWFGPASRGLRQVVARGWLATHGMLPWRLKGLLNDAYRRGVLRRAGGQFEFRHREIERYLAARSGWIGLKIDAPQPD